MSISKLNLYYKLLTADIINHFCDKYLISMSSFEMMIILQKINQHNYYYLAMSPEKKT